MKEEIIEERGQVLFGFMIHTCYRNDLLTFHEFSRYKSWITSQIMKKKKLLSSYTLSNVEIKFQ